MTTDDFNVERVKNLRASVSSFLVTIAICGVLPFYFGSLAGPADDWGLGAVGARWLMLALPILMTLYSCLSLASGLQNRFDRIKVGVVPICTFMALGLEASFPFEELGLTGLLLLGFAPCWLVEIYRAESYRLGCRRSSFYFLLHHFLTLGLGMSWFLSAPPDLLVLMIPVYWFATLAVLRAFLLELPIPVWEKSWP